MAPISKFCGGRFVVAAAVDRMTYEKMLCGHIANTRFFFSKIRKQNPYPLGKLFLDENF